MIAVPAVDLRGGRCVQLVGGRPEDERISLPDPVAVARRWWEAGFRSLHVVDLDAALGDGHNRAGVRALAKATPATVQVGGGLRDEAAVAEVLKAGARRAVVGTRALADRAWLEAVAERHPERLMVAADVRNGQVLTRGWTESTDQEVTELLEGLDDLPLAGILCTDVGREGRMRGIDPDAAAGIISATRHPVWISGGIASMDDLRALEDAGARGAVLGMALYSGALDAGEVAAAYGADPKPRSSWTHGRNGSG